MKYFAYGSNMSITRLTSRGITPISSKKGTLKNYRFVINKKSKKDPSIGFANIIPDTNEEVEGIIYEISTSDITLLDRFEGFPNHYRREILQIDNEDVVVYIANSEYVSDVELKTSSEYKEFILEGKEYLSKEYFNKLVFYINI